MPKIAKIVGGVDRFREAALVALKTIATPVKQTLGPDGLSILLERPGKAPISTKDGVSVANAVSVKDPVVDVFIQAIKEAAQKTVEVAGDGTTTSILLTEAIVNESFKFINVDQISPQKLAVELNNCSKIVLEELDKMKKTVTTEDEILNVAKISANGDTEIAERVVEAVDSAGLDGFISLRDGLFPGIVVERVDGYQVDNGWGCHAAFGPKLITDRALQETTLEKPYIVLYDGNLEDVSMVGNFLMFLAGKRGGNPQLPPVVLVAHKFGGGVRDYISGFVYKAHVPIMLVQTSFMGNPNSKIYMLDDLALLTGGRVIAHGNFEESLINKETETVHMEWLGRCQSVTQKKGVTLFFEGYGKPEDIQAYTTVIKKQVEDSEHEWDANLHRQRLAKIVGGVVLVCVGGITPLEMKEKKDRVEDALNATRAAIKEGVVAGGGLALFNATEPLANLGGESVGAVVLRKALEYPIRQIVINAGESPDIVVNKIVETKGHDVCVGENNNNFGFDARNKVYGDMFKMGIIDPLRVVKSAFSNALSIAVEILKGGGYVVVASDKDRIVQQNGGSMSDMFNTNLPGDNPNDTEE